jgi:hypothetical protein
MLGFGSVASGAVGGLMRGTGVDFGVGFGGKPTESHPFGSSMLTIAASHETDAPYSTPPLLIQLHVMIIAFPSCARKREFLIFKEQLPTLFTIPGPS